MIKKKSGFRSAQKEAFANRVTPKTPCATRVYGLVFSHEVNWRCERPNTLLVEPLPERPSNRNAKRLSVTVGDKGTLGLQMFGLMTDGCGTGTGSGGKASAPAWCHLHPSASSHLHNTLHNGADRVGYSGHGVCACVWVMTQL